MHKEFPHFSKNRTDHEEIFFKKGKAPLSGQDVYALYRKVRKLQKHREESV